MAEEKTIYVIVQPFNFGVGREEGLEIVALPAKVSAKTVRVEGCRATHWKSKLEISECHFTVEDAIRAEQKRVADLELSAAAARARLEVLKEKA